MLSRFPPSRVAVTDKCLLRWTVGDAWHSGAVVSAGFCRVESAAPQHILVGPACLSNPQTIDFRAWKLQRQPTAVQPVLRSLAALGGRTALVFAAQAVVSLFSIQKAPRLALSLSSPEIPPSSSSILPLTLPSWNFSPLSPSLHLTIALLQLQNLPGGSHNRASTKLYSLLTRTHQWPAPENHRLLPAVTTFSSSTIPRS